MARDTSDPNASPTAIAVVVFTLLVAITLIALQAYFGRATSRELEAKVIHHVPTERARVRAEQLESLASYRWIDRDAGVVGIPVERAMAIVTQELAQGGSR